MQHLEAIVLGGANAGPALGGGARGTDPLSAAAILHELDVAVATVVQLNRFPLALGEVERGPRVCNDKRVYDPDDYFRDLHILHNTKAKERARHQLTTFVCISSALLKA